MPSRGLRGLLIGFFPGRFGHGDGGHLDVPTLHVKYRGPERPLILQVNTRRDLQPTVDTSEGGREVHMQPNPFTRHYVSGRLTSCADEQDPTSPQFGCQGS